MNIALLRTALRNVILSYSQDHWRVTVNGTEVHMSRDEGTARQAFDLQLVGAPQTEAGQG